MSTLTLRSPAKANLFLRILRRRPDGFHDLASLFQALAIYDELHFRLAPEDRLRCNIPALPTDGRNLVLKATDLFRRKTGLSAYVDVFLDKKIPFEAGLGGGSGNAATTLWALNELTQRPVTTDQLITWAGEIGSDVAFFLSQGTAYCTGRGEIMRQLPPLPPAPLLIVKPSESLSTKSVYERYQAANAVPRDPEHSLDSYLKGTPTHYNDLEEPAFQLIPDLRKLKDSLQASGFEQVMMAGSGTAFLCFGKGYPPSAPGLQSFPTHFVNRPPNAWY